jgi:hypothetical protein
MSRANPAPPQKSTPAHSTRTPSRAARADASALLQQRATAASSSLPAKTSTVSSPLCSTLNGADCPDISVAMLKSNLPPHPCPRE